MGREKREAELGLEAASPVNLEALEAKGEGEEEERKNVFAEAEETRRVCLTPLAAIVASLSLATKKPPSSFFSLSRVLTLPSSSPRERALCGLDLDFGPSVPFL